MTPEAAQDGGGTAKEKGARDASPMTRRPGKRAPVLPDASERDDPASGEGASARSGRDVGGSAPAGGDHESPELGPMEAELDLLSARLAEAEATVRRLERERDAAVSQRKAAARALEGERQDRERALSDARAEEREKAAEALAEGAALRARMEHERSEAFAVRDAALRERDGAVAAKEQALAERKDAIAERKAALRDRDKADRARDSALREAERALAAREKAFQERDQASAAQDVAIQERDAIVSAHERGLPVKPPQPRFLPAEGRPETELDVWIPRAVALAIVFIFFIVVLRLFL